LCGEWDAQFGDVSLTQVKGYKTVPIVWWDFLTSDAPCSPVDGLREGDVLLSLDNTEVASVKQFEALVAKLDKARAVTLLVRRGETVNFLIVRPAK